jgi:hypothetical protein
MGYNTFDQRRYEEKGEKYRSTHLGNKVTKINYKKSISTDVKADMPIGKVGNELWRKSNKYFGHLGLFLESERKNTIGKYDYHRFFVVSKKK